MHRLEAALDRLDTALAAPSRLAESWRQGVRDRLGDVASELSDERAVAGDTGLDARADLLHRERNRLLARISVLGPMVDSGDLDAGAPSALYVLAAAGVAGTGLWGAWLGRMGP